MTGLQRLPWTLMNRNISCGKFCCYVQKRFMKAVDSAQTRLDNRTRDLRLDKLVKQMKKLKLVLRMHELMSKRRASHTSIQLLSRWSNIIGLNVGVGSFIKKHPHFFQVYMHPIKRNLCLRFSQKMSDLIAEEAVVIRKSEMVTVQVLKKLLMMSTSGSIHAHALWLVRREFGLPNDFRDSIVSKYPEIFRLVHPDTIELLSWDDNLAVAEIEKWRENEYREKWLSEYETRYAFPINFPTGFRIPTGYREKLKNWQRMSYLKPYEKREAVRVRTRGGVDRLEKRVVGILHEFLCLTVEKMVDVERLSHFRRDFSMEENLREILLKHPGIFYISAKGNSLTVFLREKYSKGCLLEPNPIYTVRRKMLDLVLLERRFINLTKPLEEMKDTRLACFDVASESLDCVEEHAVSSN